MSRRQRAKRGQDTPNLTKAMLTMKARASGPCYWCSRPMTEGDTGTGKTFDHKVPLARNGTHSTENGRIICKSCNGDKGNMTEDEYAAFKVSGLSKYEFKWTIPSYREAYIAEGRWTPEQVKAAKEAKERSAQSQIAQETASTG